MQFNVPQFIDIEDRIVGPLTAKQLGWLALGGVILLVLWNFLDTGAFIISVLVVGFIFGALAFLRPHNQTLFSFVIASFGYVFRPKSYVWKKDASKGIAIAKTSKSSQKNPSMPVEKSLTNEELEKLSETLDKNKL